MKVIALDLEGTLISNAVSQIARPGLFDFLEECRKLFPRIVIFTSVNEERFRSIANLLITKVMLRIGLPKSSTSIGPGKQKISSL